MIEVIAEHSIRTDILEPGDYILDAGCRSYAFANEMARRGYTVIAMDPDPEVKDPTFPNVLLTRLALSTSKGEVRFKMSADPQARRIADDGEEVVGCTTIQDMTGNRIWGAVKLDIEGSEMGVLRGWPGPISKQLSIEFHNHIRKAPEHEYEAIFRRLGQWYVTVSHELTDRHCAGKNWWDTLLVLKEYA